MVIINYVKVVVVGVYNWFASGVSILGRQDQPSSAAGTQQREAKNASPVRSLLLLPPHQDWKAWDGAPPLDEEDLEKPYRLLSKRGFSWTRLEINGFPANPAANAHPLFRAIDPFRALRVLLTLRRTDLVVCFFESSALLVVLARRVLGFRGKVIIVDLGMPGWRPRRMILDLVVPRADAILPYSTAQARVIRDTWPNAKRVIAVQAQVDTEFYAETLDKSDGPVVAIGDDASRDYTTLLAAARSVPHRIIIRSKLVPLNGLPSNVEIIERLPWRAYRDLIASASIIVLPMHSVENGGGTSVLVQAMASGKAVVASASPGILDYVEDGETALLVPCGDAGALAAAVSRLLNDHDLRCRMGNAARQRALRFNSYEAWANTIETVANLVINQSPGLVI